MNYNMFRGILRNSTMLVTRLMEEFSVEFQNSMIRGEIHQYLYGKVDSYLRDNGVKADRKTINVLTDLGKEMFINGIVQDLFLDRRFIKEYTEFAEKRTTM